MAPKNDRVRTNVTNVIDASPPDQPTQIESESDETPKINTSQNRRTEIQLREELSIQKSQVAQLEKELAMMKLEVGIKTPPLTMDKFPSEIRSFMKCVLSSSTKLKEIEKKVDTRRQKGVHKIQVTSDTMDVIIDLLCLVLRQSIEAGGRNRGSGMMKRSAYSLITSFLTVLRRLGCNTDKKRFEYFKNRNEKEDINKDYDQSKILHVYQAIVSYQLNQP
ncbi:hypothetical protein CAEBREN_24734 [Caenorhabditis brenneri]|uniref:DUF4806 domain-containing protein n=1 Tax=Caenorhabditis brenneri TaxID=135651 RepID=G0NL71_CAEBE|nr:hypothetical protein CAEBREN_24734 [Caenorhabditis brenneri]